MVLKFKIFESLDTEGLEKQLNDFSESHVDEISKESLVKVYYNRTQITQKPEAFQLSNSAILVWDNNPIYQQSNKIDTIETYEGLDTPEVYEKYWHEFDVTTEILIQDVIDTVKAKKHTDKDTPLLLPEVLPKWKIGICNYIFSKLQVEYKEKFGESNGPKKKWIIRNKVDRIVDGELRQKQ